MPTFTYTSNGTFALTSSVSATIVCVGAGGHGSNTGNGGSGGAYAKTVRTLQSGSYPVVVGLATATDGGNSSVTSASVIICRAPGGKRDGTIAHQTALLTGSTVVGYGGQGCPDFLGYASYNGSGGGEAGTGVGAYNGKDGESGFYSTGVSPAAGGSSTGVNGTSGNGAGGAGAYYYAGAGVNQVFPAGNGAFPGGGGGGSYDYGTDNSGNGAHGAVYISY